jgi:hypothetical protein
MSRRPMHPEKTRVRNIQPTPEQQQESFEYSSSPKIKGVAGRVEFSCGPSQM